MSKKTRHSKLRRLPNRRRLESGGITLRVVGKASIPVGTAAIKKLKIRVKRRSVKRRLEQASWCRRTLLSTVAWGRNLEFVAGEILKEVPLVSKTLPRNTLPVPGIMCRYKGALHDPAASDWAGLHCACVTTYVEECCPKCWTPMVMSRSFSCEDQRHEGFCVLDEDPEFREWATRNTNRFVSQVKTDSKTDLVISGTENKDPSKLSEVNQMAFAISRRVRVEVALRNIRRLNMGTEGWLARERLWLAYHEQVVRKTVKLVRASDRKRRIAEYSDVPVSSEQSKPILLSKFTLTGDSRGGENWYECGLEE
jgi:hypothetical protein